MGHRRIPYSGGEEDEMEYTDLHADLCQTVIKKPIQPSEKRSTGLSGEYHA